MGKKKANTKPPPGPVPDWRKYPGLQKYAPKHLSIFKRAQVHGQNGGRPDDTPDDDDSDYDPRTPTASILERMMPV